MVVAAELSTHRLAQFSNLRCTLRLPVGPHLDRGPQGGQLGREICGCCHPATGSHISMTWCGPSQLRWGQVEKANLQIQALTQPSTRTASILLIIQRVHVLLMMHVANDAHVLHRR